MMKLLAFGMGPALAVLVLSGSVQAQPVVQVVQGTIRLADCAANTLTLSADDGTHSFRVSSATAIYVDSATTGLCALSNYVGAHATVWASGNGDQLQAQRVDVGLAPDAPAPYGNAPSDDCGHSFGPYYGPYATPCYYPFR